MAPAIEVQGVSKWFGEHLAVDGASFHIDPGEVVGFLGQNGAGKSTTMRMIAGLIGPDAGRVLVRGVDVVTDPVVARRGLGFLPERPPLYGDMTVAQALEYVAALFDAPPGAVAHVLGALGLRDEATTTIAQLSKGLRQRVGIAQCLVHQPDLLVLDEPQSGLDPGQRAELREILRDRARSGAAVLLSTHVLAEVEQSCDRVIVIHRGQIALQQPIGGLHGEHFVRVEQPPDDFAAKLEAIAGVRNVRPDGSGWRVWVDRVAVRSLSSACVAYGLLELRPASSLESAFRELTGGHG